MAVTSGFFNSLSGDRRYSAIEFSELFDGVIIDGIFKSIGTAFEITPVRGLTIDIGEGRAWFKHTWTKNDAVIETSLLPAAELQNRIDVVVIEVNAGDETRANSVKVLTGTPASEPVPPTITKDDGNKIWQYPIAYIYVHANATALTTEDITDLRGTSDCPYALVVEDMSDIRHYCHIDVNPTTGEKTIVIGNDSVTPISYEDLANQGEALLLINTSNSTLKTSNVKAINGAVGTSQLRNIHAGTSALTPKSSTLATGAIYVQYE